MQPVSPSKLSSSRGHQDPLQLDGRPPRPLQFYDNIIKFTERSVRRRGAAAWIDPSALAIVAWPPRQSASGAFRYRIQALASARELARGVPRPEIEYFFPPDACYARPPCDSTSPR